MHPTKTGGPLLLRMDLQVQDVKDLLKILHESGTSLCAEHLRLTHEVDQCLSQQSRITLLFTQTTDDLYYMLPALGLCRAWFPVV